MMATPLSNIGFKIAALCITALLLSSCSTSTNSKREDQSPSASAQPTCSSSESADGKDWIEGQLKAFKDSDPEAAYAFASESFQSGSSLEQFISIIAVNYGFLINLGGYEIDNCAKIGGFYTFTVKVRDKEGNNYTMRYSLTLKGSKWGVDSAAVVSNDDDPSYS